MSAPPTKEELILLVKDWVKIESDISILNKELKVRRNRKKELTKRLVEIMKNNEIDCFDINDGKVVYTQSKVRAPLNKQQITESLSKYFGDTADMPVEEITQFILENRQIKINENIKLRK
jgi:hypothetical protein